MAKLHTPLCRMHHGLIRPGLRVRELRTSWRGTVDRFDLDPCRRRFAGAWVLFDLTPRPVFILATELDTI